jgi:hypothetical protein
MARSEPIPYRGFPSVGSASGHTPADLLSPSGEPQNEPSGENELPGDRAAPGDERPQIFRERIQQSPPPTPPDDTRTGIIRRHPTGPIPQPLSDDTFTSIIRRQPTSLPPGHGDESATGIIAPPQVPGQRQMPRSTTAVAAATVSIVSGWATSVVATALITGWWRTDRLFCVGMGFLTAVFGAATIVGVVGLLLRRRVGIYLSIVGAVLALMIFSGIFIAGAHMAGIVRALPILPAASLVLALMPATWRWMKPG